jgi:hypothetical protein
MPFPGPTTDFCHYGSGMNSIGCERGAAALGANCNARRESPQARTGGMSVGAAAHTTAYSTRL